MRGAVKVNSCLCKQVAASTFHLGVACFLAFVGVAERVRASLSASGMPLPMIAVVPGFFLFVLPASHACLTPSVARPPMARAPQGFPGQVQKDDNLDKHFVLPETLPADEVPTWQSGTDLLSTSGRVSPMISNNLALVAPPLAPALLSLPKGWHLAGTLDEIFDVARSLPTQSACTGDWGKALLSVCIPLPGQISRDRVLDPPEEAQSLDLGVFAPPIVSWVHCAAEIDRIRLFSEGLVVKSFTTGLWLTSTIKIRKPTAADDLACACARLVASVTVVPCIVVGALGVMSARVCLYWGEHALGFTLDLSKHVLMDLARVLVECVVRPVRFTHRYPTLSVLLVFGCWINGADAVTCFSCHDACPGCTGGATCPYYTQPFINQGILGSDTGTHDETIPGGDGVDARTVTHTVLAATLVLPRVIARFMTRGVLDFFKTVARRPRGGATPDVDTLTEAELVAAVRGGSITPDDAMASVLTRISTATQAAAPRLNALASTIGHLTKMGSTSTTVGSGSNGELLGAFTFAWTQAGRVVQHAGATLAVAGEALSSDVSEGRAILQAKILRPRSQSEFFHMLHVWGMVCHAMGLANTLATGTFALKVVFDQISTFGLTWQQAHELFLVYLEAVETAHADSSLTLANVYESGGQDMYREKALTRAKEHFKVPGGKVGDGGEPPVGGERIFRGQSTPSASKCCLTFNLGRDKHPQAALDKNGRCLFAHKCDHWVTQQADGTKGGTCGSTKHGRHNCNNAHKCDAKVTG